LCWAVLDLFIASARGLGLTAIEHRQLAQMRAATTIRTPDSLTAWDVTDCEGCAVTFQRRPDATGVRRTSAMVRAWVVPEMSHGRRVGSVIVTAAESRRRFTRVEVTDKMRRKE